MNYELAKELKEAGFPQDGSGQQFICLDENRDKVESKSLYIPTLEELIEACGKPIWIEGSNIPEFLWLAGKGKGMDTPLGGGSTPSEAVARLWLALNKK